METYPVDHEVTIYETAVVPVCDPIIIKVPLRDLPSSRVTVLSTLYIPPLPPRPVDEKIRARILSIPEFR
jgi:hypothetical protein